MTEPPRSASGPRVAHGPRNLITDVPGIRVGQARDLKARTGVTIILAESPAVGAADARGGATGTRELETMDPSVAGPGVHAISLSGGSVFGLDAASGAASALSVAGYGLSLYPGMPPVPIVPGAILFDLVNGGDKAWGLMPPYRALGAEAVTAALGPGGLDVALGTEGAGTGAVAGGLKGGVGSVSALIPGGPAIGALFAVNAVGSVLVPGTRTFWAAPFAQDGELGTQAPIPTDGMALDWPVDAKFPLSPITNTTIGVVATDADLTRGEAKRVAIMAQDGLARAIRPVHTPFDGDVVFVLATGRHPLTGDRARAVARIGTIAADCVARAIARGVYEATALGSARAYRDG